MAPELASPTDVYGLVQHADTEATEQAKAAAVAPRAAHRGSTLTMPPAGRGWLVAGRLAEQKSTPRAPPPPTLGSYVAALYELVLCHATLVAPPYYKYM